MATALLLGKCVNISGKNVHTFMFKSVYVSGENVDTFLPKNERQLRPLTKLSAPEQKVYAWQKAVSTAHLHQASDGVLGAGSILRGVGTRCYIVSFCPHFIIQRPHDCPTSLFEVRCSYPLVAA